MDTEAPSTVWLLWTLLLETSGCRCPGISLHLYLWGKSPAMQLLGRRAGLFLTLWGTSTQFSRVAAPVPIPTNSVRGFPFLLSLHPLQHLWFPALLIFPILTGVRWDFIVVWIYFSLMASDAEHFLTCMLAMSMSSSVRFLFMSFAHFMIGLFVSVEFNKFFIDLGN